MFRPDSPQARERPLAPADHAADAAAGTSTAGPFRQVRRKLAIARPLFALLLLLAVLQPSFAGMLPDALDVAPADAAPTGVLDGADNAGDLHMRPLGAGVSANAVSAGEAFFNPFGDPWSSRTQANPDVPVGLTPACHRAGARAGQTTPSADEVAWLATTTSKIVFEECLDLRDHSNGVGDPYIKAMGAALAQANSSIIYTGYMPGAIASTDTLGSGNAQPVGLQWIDANREEWFVHKANTTIIRANRLKYNQGNPRWDVYDMTNPSLRAYLIQQIIASMNFHNIKGLAIDGCYDQVPLAAEIPNNVMPPATASNWENGCVAFLQELKAAAGANRRVFFLGYLHLGTQNQSSPVNEAAAHQFYLRRANVSDGMLSEDMYGPMDQPANMYQHALARVELLLDAAEARNQYMGFFVNSNARGQSSFGTTNYNQQKTFAKFYLWMHLLSYRNAEKNPLIYYTPVQSSNQFHSAANYADWKVRIGAPQGRRTEPQTGLWRRTFQNGLVYFNTNTTTLTLTPGGGPYYNTAGQPVTTFNLPSKQGMILVTAAGVGDGATPTPTTPPTPIPTATMTPTPVLVCPSPRPPVRVSTAAASNGRLRVDLSAGAPPFLRVVVGNTTNAVVDFPNGPTGVTNQTYTISGHPSSYSFFVRRVAAGPATVPITVVDACGNWNSFVGGGASAF